MLKKSVSKLTQFTSKHGKAAVCSLLAICSLMVSSLAAGDPDVTAMTNAFSTIADKMVAGVSAVAPIALGVVGAIILWKFGVRFFKGIAK